ncbi:heme exporter protein CcmD [Coralliovum pocilloporae]|uniref:heme exporter protein CcmD n=1 Tax=Coralliovum pocilloporae TaxID=3066369 RepID=UPI0033074B01
MLIWGPHAGYIAASYGIAILVLAVLIGWIIIDGRTQKRLLTELEKSGIGRRSAARMPDGDAG